RLDPYDRGRLILTPLIATRPGLDTRERRAFVRGHIGNALHDGAAPRPDLDVLRKSAHRDEMGERPLDFRDEHVLPAWRRRDGAEYGGPADRGLHSGSAVDRRKLAREVVFEQRIVVRGLQQILVGR